MALYAQKNGIFIRQMATMSDPPASFDRGRRDGRPRGRPPSN
jgi:hypothetical protein